jgi:uncharacterized protein (DUF2141 family)
MQLRPLLPILGSPVQNRPRPFGRVLAGLIAAAALSGAAPAEPGAVVSVRVEGLRSTKGQVLACLTAVPKGFPQCKDGKLARSRLAIPAAQAATIDFGPIEAGRYAIALLHDENGNGKVDSVIMIPKEGFGFSRNPAVVTGPPSFNAAAFTVGDGPVLLTIRMRYML